MTHNEQHECRSYDFSQMMYVRLSKHQSAAQRCVADFRGFCRVFAFTSHLSPDALRAPSTAFSTSFAVSGKGSSLPASRRAAKVVARAATSSAASSCSNNEDGYQCKT